MKITIILLLTLLFSSCDCVQKASGVVVDIKTLIPINNVAIGKTEIEDSLNPFSARFYTDSSGLFQFRGISGGIFRCHDLTLYFFKEDYKSFKIDYRCGNCKKDTIYLVPLQEAKKFYEK